VDTFIDEGDELPILGGIRVLHLPGHTPGSIGLHIPQERLFIAGDVIAHRFGLHLPARDYTVDLEQESQSIKKLAALDFDVICLGHGASITYQAHDKIARFAERVT
jgi:glyoxylase-like metal-dependent hydrolase (beta-lactamase superfamily II)